MSTEPGRVVVSWSGGKDAAWALHQLRQEPGLEIAGLLTTVNRAFHRVAMHGVRVELLRAQADAAGLPLHEVPLPWPCNNERYEAAMRDAISRLRRRWHMTHLAFGDLFLEDVRAYRVARLVGTGIEPLFPIWGRPTRELAETMLAAGVRARIVCLDPMKVTRELAGREIDRELLEMLPAGVDWCGERGEFHTFVAEGPMLARPISVKPGDVVEREGFVYADLLAA
ncbi:MAG: ATP-binding protein [Gemmatimonadales bacterium]